MPQNDSAGLARRCWQATTAIGLIAAPPMLGKAYAEQVRIEAGEKVGQGLLRARGSSCFAIAPWHVVKSAPTSIVVSSFAGEKREGTIVVEDKANDLVVIEVKPPGGFKCPGQWPRSDVKIEKQLRGALSTVEEGKQDVRLFEIRALTPDTLEIRFNRPADNAFQGMSGSIALIDDVPVGMLMGEAAVSADGLFRVLRQERIVDLTRSFFKDSAFQEMSTTSALDFLRRAREERSIGDIGQGNALANLVSSRYDLSGLSFRGLSLSRSPIKTFDGLKYQSGQGEGFHCDACSLDGAEMQKTRLSYGSLAASHLNRAHLEGAVLDFIDAHDLKAVGLVAPASRWMFANLESAHLAGATLTESLLAFANLRTASLANVDLRRSSLAGADLRGADLRGAKLEDADFTDAVLDGAKVDPKELVKACFYADGIGGEVRFINEIPSSRFSGGIENQIVMQRHYRAKEITNKHGLKACDRAKAAVHATQRGYISHYGFYPSALPVKDWARTALERMGAAGKTWAQPVDDKLD